MARCLWIELLSLVHVIQFQNGGRHKTGVTKEVLQMNLAKLVLVYLAVVRCGVFILSKCQT